MEKRGQVIKIVIIFMILVVLIVIGIVIWEGIKGTDKKNTNNTDITVHNTTQGNISGIINNNASIENETNGTIQTNETIETNETISTDIPNPTGSVIFLDMEDAGGGYFCNKTEKPKHQVRLYTYRIINKTKNLSKNYIESQRINNVCEFYENVTVTKGLRYSIRWEWEAVEKIDGYRIYQDYSSYRNNITRNYTHYVDIRAPTQRFLDTGLNLWTLESSK